MEQSIVVTTAASALGAGAMLLLLFSLFSVNVLTCLLMVRRNRRAVAEIGAR
jgi:hypothetical protein